MKYQLQTFGIACLLFVVGCDVVEPTDMNNMSATEEFMGAELIASGGAPSDQVWCDVLEQQVPRKDCEALSQAAQVTDGSAAFNVPDPMKRGQHTSVQLIVDRRTPNVIKQLDNMATGNAMADGNIAAEGNDAKTASRDLPGETEEVPAQDRADNSTFPNSNAQDPDSASIPKLNPSATGGQNPTPKQQTDKLRGTTDTFDLKVGRRMRADLTGQGFTIIRRSPGVQEIPRDDQGTWTWEIVALQGGPKTLTVTTLVEAAVNGRVYQLQQTKHLKTVNVGVTWGDRIKDWLRGVPEWLQLIGAVLMALAGVAGAWWLVKRNWRSGPGGGSASGAGGGGDAG